jgi:hypothetical protein
MAIAGLFFSFFKGWYYSLLLLAYFPLMFISAFLISFSMQRGFEQNLRAYG